MSLLARCFASGSYHVPTASVRHCPTGCPPEHPAFKPAVLSTLKAVLQELADLDTSGARKLRADVQRLLDKADQAQRTLDPASHLPSLVQAREWLAQARYDARTNPGALNRLRLGLLEFQARWTAFSLPSEGRLRRPFLQLQEEIDQAVRASSGRPGAEKLWKFEERLKTLNDELLDWNAQRDAAINARLRSQLGGPAERLRSSRPPGARSPAPG